VAVLGSVTYPRLLERLDGSAASTCASACAPAPVPPPMRPALPKKKRALLAHLASQLGGDDEAENGQTGRKKRQRAAGSS